ncbi:hypothetical protein CYG49_01800 [Candidatus Saccharibacteria bacterium]|nr:MAG: hypothetical protein CYG49_01800 [Candidatus Saccharibacteria bacterium]
MAKKQKQALLHSSISHFRKNQLVFSLRAVIVLLVAVIFVVKREFWTPDTLFLILLVIFVAFGQTRSFLVRFVPLIALLLVYDSFRSIADDLNKNVHYFEMIVADRTLFGGVLPTVYLQEKWWNGHLQWYDFYFYSLYTAHFLLPVLLAVILWKLRPFLYWRYVSALVLLSFAAFITYVLFPAAPPWLASDKGFIEPIHRISSDIWMAMGVTNFSEVYSKLSPNLVAAVPSLHSAYPLLFTLFLVRAFGFRRMGWLIIYPVSMWIGVVYLGEHYVIDAILGAMYALAAYFIANLIFDWMNSRQLTKH